MNKAIMLTEVFKHPWKIEYSIFIKKKKASHSARNFQGVASLFVSLSTSFCTDDVFSCKNETT